MNARVLGLVSACGCALLVGCNPALREGELQAGKFRWVCGDGSTDPGCNPDRFDAARFPATIAEGATFEVVFVPDGADAGTVPVFAASPRLLEGSSGRFHAKRSGLVALLAGREAIVDLLHVTIAKPRVVATPHTVYAHVGEEKQVVAGLAPGMGGALRYFAEVDRPELLEVRVSGRTVTLTALGEGIAELRLRAGDASAPVKVVVSADRDAGPVDEGGDDGGDDGGDGDG